MAKINCLKLKKESDGRLSHINFTIDAFLCNVDEDKKISLIEDNWYNLSTITKGVPKYQNKIIDKFGRV